VPFLSIAGRELRSLFVSPLAWAALALVQFVLAWMFLVQIDQYVPMQPQLAGITGAPGVSDLLIAPWLANAGLVLILLTPLLSMRLLSQEIANGSLHLLLAAPLGLGQIVLGKYLGLLGFLALLLVLTAAMPLSLMAGSELDLGKLAAGLLGLGLLLAAAGAIGLYLSARFRQPAAAATAGLGLLAFLWLADHSVPGGEDAGIFTWLSLTHHYQFLLRGLVRSNDLAYFLLLILLPLALTVQRLDQLRRDP
jgi:ABC-2 type transport system permease protein